VIAADRILAAEDTQKAGPLGLLVLIILMVACYFLFKSMSKHLRRVREEFPADAPADAATVEDEGSDISANRAVSDAAGSRLTGASGAAVPAVADRVDPPAE
jgi:hypothetical protein